MRTATPSTHAVRVFLFTIAFFWILSPESASAQATSAGFFSDPILVLRVGGHNAPVRSMVFTPGGTQLLTGGLDKVINVWNLDGDRSGPSRTLRPPFGRGPRGQINAMALSPRDDGGNQRLLAVAGFGVISDAGEILLYRYPGPNPQGTGDVEAQLSSTGAPGAGHRNAVTSLAFTPDGKFLVSASVDKTVRIWEIATRRQVAVLEDSRDVVNAIAITPDGRKLISGGEDGILRLYDITDRARPIFTALVNPAIPDQLAFLNAIRTMAISPDGVNLIVGTYGGSLYRYNATDLGAGRPLRDVRSGPILAIAISPDSSRFAASFLKGFSGKISRPDTASIIEIRSIQAGQLIEALAEQPDTVEALAFSPDGRRLVHPGGNGQGIVIKDLAPGAPAIPDEIRGAGTTIWDVGIRTDQRAIRFSRTKTAAAGRATDYEYFDLRGRAFFIPEPAEPAYRHALAVEAGWTIRPTDSFQLAFQNDAARVVEGKLDPNLEGRWWSYCMIPPTADHPQPVAAVGTNSGQVVLWNLITGEKTRIFNGHQSAVLSLASSFDGRWLATVSSDQTIRLWSLVGCEKRPPFGARFDRQANGTWRVAEVAPGGFAEGMGLKKDHVVEKLVAEGASLDLATTLPRLDFLIPGPAYIFDFRLNGDAARPLIQALTTRRDSAALSFFPGIDRRWVFWTPRGYYDSSADGDRRFLGWLTNRGTVAQLLAGRFDSIDKFEARFRQPRTRQPNVIDRLLDTANPALAEAVALVAVPANPAQPPPADPVTSRLSALDLGPAVPFALDRPLVAAQPTIPINFRAVAQAGAAGISRLSLELNGRIVATLKPENGQAVRELAGRSDVALGNERDLRLSLVAIDERGVRRDQSIDLTSQAPLASSVRKPSLLILGLGSERFQDTRFPSILWAEDDVRDLTRFLANKLVDPTTGSRFPSDRVQARSLLGGKLSGLNVADAFQAFSRQSNGEPLGPGDVVALVIESHFLDFRSKRLLATADSDPGDGEAPAISATALVDRLGELSRLGCRILVLVDAVHEIKSPAWETDIQEWVRELQGRARVLTFIASDHGPSFGDGDGHRVFAQGILEVSLAKNAGRLRKPGGTMSLFDFQRTVIDTVLQQTGRKQQAQCYLPDTMSYRIPLLDTSP